MADLRRREKEIEKKVMRQEIMLDKLEDKSFIIWVENYSVVEQAELESELAIMEAEDGVKMAEYELTELKENIRRITIFCREKVLIKPISLLILNINTNTNTNN